MHKYRLYILILIGALVGGAIGVIFSVRKQIGTDPSNQPESNSGQQSNSETSDLSKQSGISDGNVNQSGIFGGNVNQSGIFGGNVNQSGISGGNANESSSLQSGNNPFGST